MQHLVLALHFLALSIAFFPLMWADAYIGMRDVSGPTLSVELCFGAY